MQTNFYDRYVAYKYCCSIGMNMTMENDVASRLAVMKFMNTDRPSNGAGNHLTNFFSLMYYFNQSQLRRMGSYLLTPTPKLRVA